MLLSPILSFILEIFDQDIKVISMIMKAKYMYGTACPALICYRPEQVQVPGLAADHLHVKIVI